MKQATSSSLDNQAFLKHILSNNIVSESYVGFVITEDMVTQAEEQYITNCNNDQECIDGYQSLSAGTYYLKGEKTKEYVNEEWQCLSQYDVGNGNCLAPSYNDNKVILLNAFGSSNCIEENDNLTCWSSNFVVRSFSSGSVTTSINNSSCYINYNGYSYC